MARILVEIAGHRYYVIGGDFYPMLNAVRVIPGRRFNPDPDGKYWTIPLPLESARDRLYPYELVLAEGQAVVEAPEPPSLANAQDLQDYLLENEARLRSGIADLEDALRLLQRHPERLDTEHVALLETAARFVQLLEWLSV